jgi:ATP-dependent Clp protease ATP-binding subunit ClpC
MLAGAGSGGNSNMDAFNLLKEPLARGKIRLIGATTESEYRRYIRIDDALDRRFTVINVRESTSDETMQILNLSRGKMESEYNVVISAESIEAAVELSVRYMPNRKLPDKAFELMHRACADVNFKAELEPEAGRTVTRLNIQEAFPEGIEPGNRDLHSFDVARMADVLKERVIGQPEAAEAVTQAVQRRYVGFNDNRPIGVFLFVGPTGVGKTEMVRAVAEFLFGSPEYITRIDMSEYMDRYSQSRLIGAPPGYVGYQEGGQLTGPLMTRPKSVVLLDEVEKAHPDILNTFLQVFDAGHITDSQGHQVNAREALFVMTSNLGVHQGMAPSEDMIMLSVKSHFKPEFINRLDAIIVFRPLQPQDLLQIARNQLGQLQKMLLMKNHIRLQVTESAVQYIAEKGYDAILGVRPLIRFIDKEIRTKIAQMIINDQIFDTDTLIIDFTGIELSFTRSLGETGN